MSGLPSRLFFFVTLLAFGACESSPGGIVNPQDTTNIQDPGITNPDNKPDLTAPDLTTQVDTPPVDTNIPPTTLQRACGVKNTGLGVKQLGAPCFAHEECTTGYCYDEWYLNWAGGLRFCTIACNGCDSVGMFNACDDYNDQSNGRPLKCHIVSNQCTKTEYPEMEVKGFCVPTCVSLGQCIDAYGPGYTFCGQAKTDECGSIGTPNKVCFVPEPEL